MDKYKEALEKARAEYEKAREQGYTWLMGLLEGMFPDLKEGEDERVRKALIDGVRQIRCKNGITQEQMLAYLEKQKNKRELDFAEGKVEGVKQTCQEIKDAMSLFEPKDLTPFEFTFRDYIDSAIRYCVSGEGYQQYIKEWAADLLNLEKQKAQQPAEWSEEDETCLEYALWCVIKTRHFVAKDACDLEACRCAERWLKSLRPQPHWKPSREQMGMLLAVINNPNNAGAESCHLMLQSLYADLEKL